MHYIGLISGTSVDGIDAVVVAISHDDKFTLLATHVEPFPPGVAERAHALMNPGNDGLDAFGTLDMELGALFAQAALNVLKKSGLQPHDIRAVGSHGQTVRHRPGGQYPFTLQIGNPTIIADRTGITTVTDFRSRDIAAGGQGAPLAPAFHRWLFHSPIRNRAIVNIGGIANITQLPTSGAVAGFDTGPGNTLLDRWARRHLSKNYDDGGKWAKGGRVSSALLESFLADNYFAASAPKSTGREYFNMAWIEGALSGLATAVSPQDVQATLVELSARTIADALARSSPKADEIYVCGGGSHNSTLMHRLQHYMGETQVRTTRSLGLDPDWVEACAFAWLAHRTLEGQPGNLPAVTGARRAVILGGIYKA